MDDPQRIVKCGNLSLHTSGGFFKKRWHSKYLVLYDGSKSGVKRLELFDSEIKFKKQNPAKIIPLVDCVRVVTCQRNKTTYTFEVRTSDQFYLLAGQSFQDMNDWVNCLRLVAFGSQQSEPTQQQQQLNSSSQQRKAANNNNTNQQSSSSKRDIDVLLEKRSGNLQSPAGNSRTGPDYPIRPLDRIITGASAHSGQAPQVPTETHPMLTGGATGHHQRVTTASQAAAAAASALAKTRQRQPSLLGSCKPQPPTDSPFIQPSMAAAAAATTGGGICCDPLAGIGGQLDTMTPTVRGQLIAGAIKTPLVAAAAAASATSNGHQQQQQQHRLPSTGTGKAPLSIQATLDEEEENMLYCSIEDNPSEHNYRVKVIETELSLRCQLKCYQLTAPTTINQQYEQLGQFSALNGSHNNKNGNNKFMMNLETEQVTFYQLIIGPQELTLLNDYAALTLKQQQQQQQATQQQQGLWSWPYQCIRRYGFDKDNCFMFEAGRKCTSGPGQFIVQTPKAYSIYQDVVKFVNELRSLSTADVGNALPAGNSNSNNNNNTNTSNHEAPPTISNVNESRQQVVVTQIPVTWTPNHATIATATGAIKVDTTESREQFFNTLRQLDSSSGQQSPATTTTTTSSRQQDNNTRTPPVCPTMNTLSSQCPTPTTPTTSTTTIENNTKETNLRNAAAATTTSHPPHQSSVSPSSIDTLQSTKSLLASASGASSATGGGGGGGSMASPEETDESGYDQGDDSVDSGKSIATKSKLLSAGATTRKRQAQDSMSSASSTTSSGGGSPGHSVSRRSNGGAGGHHHPAINGQGPSKRPPLTNTGLLLPPTTDLCNKQTNNTAHLVQNQKLISPNNHSIKVSATNGGGGGGHRTSGGSLGDRLSQNQQLLGMIVGGTLPGQPEDFEANLIRDVYSEITKLHATFAVARGSADDESMSNNSSNEDSTQSSSDQFGASDLQGEPNNDSGLGNGGGRRTKRRQDNLHEPMYSNLRRIPRGANGNEDLDEEDGDDDDDEEEEEEEESYDEDGDMDNNDRHLSDPNRRKTYFQNSPARNSNQHHQLQHHYQQQNDQSSSHQRHPNTPSNSYVQNHGGFDYLSLPRCGPIYPTMLNPIPECGELTPQLALSKVNRKQQTMANLNGGGNVGAVSGGGDSNNGGSRKASQRDERTHQMGPTNQRSKVPSLIKSRLPTNHYVINDVQYAKISRNICSKYESCL